MLKSIHSYAPIIVGLLAFLLLSCNEDYRPYATGDFGHVTIIIDPSSMERALGKQAQNLFNTPIETLPQQEPRLTAHWHGIPNQRIFEQLKRQRNIVVIAPLNDTSTVGDLLNLYTSDSFKNRVKKNEAFVSQIKNVWYKDQLCLFITANDSATLINVLEQSGEQILELIEQTDRKRWIHKLYDRGEQTQISDSLWQHHGWKMRIQHDYILRIDKPNFILLRRSFPDNERWVWVWWDNHVQNLHDISPEWINSKRDSLNKKYVHGAKDSTYVTTEYRRKLYTKPINDDNLKVWQTNGTWRMVYDAMGGAFVHFTYYTPNQQRLFFIEFSQFAPRYHKRRFVRQFEAMGQTFRIDSTWQDN